MMLQYWYVFAALATAVFFWRKDLRRAMLWAGLLTLPVILFQPLFYQTLNSLTLGTTVQVLERSLLAFSLGALASGMYEVLFGKIMTPQRHPARRKLFWLFGGLAVFVILVGGVHVPFLRALIIGLAVDLAMIVFVRHDLLWDAIVSGSALAVIYALAFFGTSFGSAASVTNPFVVSQTSGLTLFSWPLEELLSVFLFGALWGPLYAAVKHDKEVRPDEFQRLSLHPKMMVSTFILVGMFGSVAWAANEFYLPPTVQAIRPAADTGTIGLTDQITITFDRPVDRNRMTMEFSPEINGHWTFTEPTLGQHAYRKVVFTPDPAWPPSKKYRLTISQVSSLLGSNDGRWTYHYTTKSLPNVAAVSWRPGQSVNPCDPLAVTLNGPNDQVAEFSWQLEPAADLQATQSADHLSYRLVPVACLRPGTTYTLTVKRVVTAFDGGPGSFGVSDPLTVYSQTLTTAGPPPVAPPAPVPLSIREVSPRSAGIGVNSSIRANFSQAVDHGQAQSKFSTMPAITGSFSWDGQVMIFKPSAPLAFDTTYTVTIGAGVPSTGGQTLAADYRWTFSTSTPTTLLNIAEDYQDKPLSCEAAALKMALAGKGIKASENEIMAIVGYDPTPHQGDVWGDPDSAYVGNISGHQNTTGYGVHWAPIARAANHWRPAMAFSNWTPAQLAHEISVGNPIVIWGVVGRAAYYDPWHTPGGKLVKAWKGEHTRTVIGFTGSPDNPKTFIINDPFTGRITWSVATLKSNWISFGYSGVVVR